MLDGLGGRFVLIHPQRQVDTRVCLWSSIMPALKLLVLFPSQLPCLSSYDSYCSNQVAAKALLDHKKQDHRVQDFLQRCLESPFSRKLDLWNFLDIPRSRLVKYPLLLREILRHTPNDNPDQQHLEEAVSMLVSFLFRGYLPYNGW